MPRNFKKKLIIGLAVFVIAVVGISAWQVFVPRDFGNQKTVFYNAQSGLSEAQIAKDLKSQRIISSSFFFKIYALISGNYTKLQAGLYNVSPSMSIADIIYKLARGDVAKNKITILEGWDIQDIAEYLENKNFYSRADFDEAVQTDYSAEFDFLKSKPKNSNLEGYIFPDTYQVPMGFLAEDFLRMTLNNFNKKLTPELRKQITKNKKTIHQVVIMASILEKEVRSLDDKKMVAGVLWKRAGSGMPLQVDATVNYATGKSDARAKLADTKIDSPYNTYKYYGLPIGPISNPGLEALTAAIYPTKSAYWFYLSANGTGKTIFSKTYQEHTSSITKYLNS